MRIGSGRLGRDRWVDGLYDVVPTVAEDGMVIDRPQLRGLIDVTSAFLGCTNPPMLWSVGNNLSALTQRLSTWYERGSSNVIRSIVMGLVPEGRNVTLVGSIKKDVRFDIYDLFRGGIRS